MAGKPSTGCRTCVKRRVKCDETRPACLRCKKGNRPCPGYTTPSVFRQTIFIGGSSGEPLPQDGSGHQEDPNDTQKPSSTQIRKRSLDRFIQSECSTNLRGDISLAGFANNLYSSFLVNKYWGSNDHARTNRQWFVKCLTEDNTHPTSSLALEALAMAYFGRKHRQNQIVSQSSALYGQALRALSQNIQDPEKLFSFDTLAAVTALSLFEYCALTTQTAYIRHTSALSRIFELRGPSSFSQYPEKAILQSQRPLIIVQAVAARKRTFLGNPEWLAIHERDIANPDTPRTIFDVPMARMLNIFATVPGVMEDIETIHKQRVLESLGAGPVDERLLENTTASMSHWLDALHQWRRHYDPLFARCCWETSSRMRMTRDSEGPLFDSILWYDSLEAASIWTLYTTITLSAHEQSYILQNPSFSLNTSFPYLSTQYISSCRFEDYLPSVVPLAHTIMRSVEYHLQPIHVNSGTFYILWPARLAYMALRRTRRETKWLRQVVERIAEEGGLELARTILGDGLLEIVRREAWSGRTPVAQKEHG